MKSPVCMSMHGVAHIYIISNSDLLQEVAKLCMANTLQECCLLYGQIFRGAL